MFGWNKKDMAVTDFDKEWKQGDRAKAKQMAIAYVMEHAKDFAWLGEMAIPQVVTLVEEARDAKNEERRIKLDMYLLAKFEPQNITTVINKEV